jgi:hypothetical protein
MNVLPYILLGWLLTVAAATALGTWILRALKLELEGLEDWLYRFLLGAAGLSLLVFGLASLGLIHKGVLIALGLGLVASNYRRWPLLPKWKMDWSGWLYAAFALFYFLHALAPELSPDGMSYHLGLVARYTREHGFVPFTTNMYALLSQGLEMLFLFAFGIGRHSAAALVHFTFLLALPALLAVHGGRKGWLAGLFVFLLPVTAIDGISAYNDVALAVVGFAIFHAVSRSRQTGHSAWVSVAALLLGFAFAIKMTGAVFALFLIPSWHSAGRCAWRWGWALVSIAPWLIRNALWTGNPLAPFFNTWFPNPYFTPDFEQYYRAFLKSYGLPSVWAWLREIFLGGQALSGTLGPMGVLLPLALLAIRRSPYLLAAAAIALIPYPMNIGTRFLLPALPFLALALFEVLPGRAWVLALTAILSLPPVMSRYSPGSWHLGRPPWKAALRIESEDGYLNRIRVEYIVARLIERLVPEGETVYTHAAVAESYTTRRILTSYQSALGVKLQQALFAPTYEPYQPRFRWECRGDRLEVSQGGDILSIHEVEPVSAKLDCSRFPWDSPLASDGNWVSRYRSWAPIQPGDFCRVSGHGNEFNVYGSADQWKLQFKNCGPRQIVDLPLDLRAEARRFFLANGVRYLVIQQADYGAQEIYENQQKWGVELLAERGPARLYRFRQ